MRHIRRYGDLNESIDYSNVELWDDYSTDDDKNSMLDGIIRQVERATGNKVVSIEGRAGESDFDVEMNLDNGDYVGANYRYSPYPDRSRKIGYTTVDYTRGDDHFTRSEFDLSKEELDKIDAGEDIYFLVNDILKEFNVSYVLTLPREHFGTTGYHYDVDNESKGYMQIDVHFDSEDEVESWIESLSDLVKKKKG